MYLTPCQVVNFQHYGRRQRQLEQVEKNFHFVVDTVSIRRQNFRRKADLPYELTHLCLRYSHRQTCKFVDIIRTKRNGIPRFKYLGHRRPQAVIGTP